MASTVTCALEQTLNGLTGNTQIYLAYSGGLDSQVLLHALANHPKANQLQLTALHVNYGLSENADQWQVFCEHQCKALDIPFSVKSVALEVSKGDLERRARDIRYRWFESFMRQDAILFTAHHQNDQAETVLLRLLRASGVRGLAAIPPVRSLAKGKLARPLLALPKADLQAYAEQHTLQWLEDESNKDLAFDRNFVRHQIIPKLTERWPRAVKQLARSAGNCADEQRLLNELAAMDVASMQSGCGLSVLDILVPIKLPILTALSLARQRNVLQYLLTQIVDYPVSATRLNEWLLQLRTHTREKSSELRLKALDLTVYDGQMYFLRPMPDMSTHEIKWKIEKPINIKTLSSTLSANIYGDKVSADVPTVNFEKENVVCVRWRQGGERVQLKGESFTRSYKKLLQERRIAPWLRNALPLISIGDQIVWSAALGDLSPVLLDSAAKHIKFKLEKNKPDSARN